MRNETVRAKVSHDTKVKAEKILNELGLSMSEAINLMLTQVKLKKALPFDISMEKVPNAETAKTLRDTNKGVGIIKCNNADDFFDKIGI